MLKALVLLSFSTNPSDAAINWCKPKPVDPSSCNGASATADYTLQNPGAPSIACTAACSASFIVTNAAIDANSTACNAAVDTANAACLSNPNICAITTGAASNACASMKPYVQSTTTDTNIQNSAACKSAKTGGTACNAAFSVSYIICNFAHSADYTACNIALGSYVSISSSPAITQAIADEELVKAVNSCKATAAKARDFCTSSMTTAQAACVWYVSLNQLFRRQIFQ